MKDMIAREREREREIYIDHLRKRNVETGHMIVVSGNKPKGFD